ncbi:MAG TPA: DNA (cytosine-5-)-methyltransferase [Crocinitomix sp.]|nr:DNA (cytosine-5-)-methyltransferase [Crocinitomix sp.]
MKRRVLSLFSGCGGMDLGFEGNFEIDPCFINSEIHPDWLLKKNKKYYLKETSFEIIFANDILKEAKAAYIPFFKERKNNAINFYSESIVDLVKMHKNKLFSFPKNIDVVIGGFPCQDFSIAGKRKGFDSHKNHNGNGMCELDIASYENRGQLYMWMKEVIEITKPKVFYAENVKGLASLGDVKKIIENDFRSIDNEGYLVLPAKVLNAADYGVPQNRERIIFIGLNKKYLKRNISKEINLYPRETHFNPKKNQLFGDNLLMPYTTCMQALNGLKEPEFEKNDLSQLSYSKAKFCKGYQGNIEIKLDHISPTIRAEHHGNIEYRRLNEENGGKYINELKTKKERRLTVRECARLQTFPDNYIFVRRRLKNELYPISASGAYRVIGNAVPPLLAYHLSKQLEHVWNDIF